MQQQKQKEKSLAEEKPKTRRDTQRLFEWRAEENRYTVTAGERATAEKKGQPRLSERVPSLLFSWLREKEK